MMTEICAACEQRYLYELEYRCIECDSPLCPICAVTVRARRTVRCVDCHDASAPDRRPE